MDENKSKSKGGISIAIILLAVVIGFGFVIGLTQTNAAKNLNNTDSEISKYMFDEEGTLLSYSGDMTELEIPATYSFSAQAEEVQMTSSSIYSLVDRMNSLGIKNYTIENQTGNYEDEFGNVYYQEKYVLTYERRKVVEGDDYQVTKIGATAFANNTKIKSVKLPESVTHINSQAFMGCTQLKSITLPEHLERIENSAFYNCRLLEDVEIPNTVSYIGPQAFQQCTNLKSINIPTGITQLTNMVFSHCTQLQEVTIPSNVRNIQSEAFYYCTSLQRVTFNEGLNYIATGAFYNCYNLTEIVLPSTLTRIENQAFNRCTALTTMVIKSTTIPYVQPNSLPTTITNIYVLDDLYADYPSYSGWYYYESQLRMMSELGIA